MATKDSKAEMPVEEKKKTEMIYLIKDSEKYKNDVFVCVNGKGYILQRGKNIAVPVEVAEVLKNSQEQDAEAADYMEEKAQEFENGLKLLI